MSKAKNLLLVVVALGLSLLGIEFFLRWVVPYRYIYMMPRFIVATVDPAESETLLHDPYLGPGLTPRSGDRSYRLRRNMIARFVSSEYDTRITTNGLGLRGK